jgi:hypothetical protein
MVPLFALLVPNHGISCHALSTIGKCSMSKGALSYFHNVSTYGEEFIEYYPKFS